MARTKGLSIEFDKASEGLVNLLNRMERHTQSGEALLAADQLEGAFLFFLLGIEELGKFVQLLDAAQVAEANRASEVHVPLFFDHENKAGLGTKNIAHAFDLFIPPLQDAGLDTSDLTESLAFLEQVRMGFRLHRERMMYVDFDEGQWVLATAPSKDSIKFGSSILWLARVVLTANLREMEDFKGFRSFADGMNK